MDSTNSVENIHKNAQNSRPFIQKPGHVYSRVFHTSLIPV